MDGGGDVTYQDPGTTRLRDINPEVYAETDYLQNLRDRYHGQFEQALEPGAYDARAARQKEMSRAAISNRFAGAGIAQSSAAFGAQQQSDIAIQDQFERQRINDMIRSMQLEAALSGQITGNIFGAQSQFGGAQNQMNQAALQAQANENALWGSIIGAGATIGGTLLAGPVGGMAGAGLAGSMTSGISPSGTGYAPMAAPGYNSYDYANQMYNSSLYNYGYGND